MKEDAGADNDPFSASETDLTDPQTTRQGPGSRVSLAPNLECLRPLAREMSLMQNDV